MPTTPLPDDDATLIRQLRQAVAALPDVPPALEQRALALFQAPSPVAAVQQAAQALAHGLLRHCVAALSFDSWGGPAVAAGMRALRSPTRHLLFSAEGRDIDLRIAPGTDEQIFVLAGQILGPDETGEVCLQRLDDGDATPSTVALDGLGEFRIDGLAPGAYQLTLRLGHDDILLPPIEVGEPPH